MIELSEDGKSVMKRSLLVGGVVAALLSVSACGGDADPEPDARKSSSPSSHDSSEEGKGSSDSASKQDVLAEAKDGDIAVKIESAVRDQGGFVTVSGTVTNNGSASWIGANWKSEETELQGNGGSLAGANLVDVSGKKKYLVLRDTGGRCLCTKFSKLLGNGESASWYAQFPAPPQETTDVKFQVGTMPPATIQISEG
ncbi:MULTISPECIES: hypothetical protein [Streptomyces]|uniref:hypothetical protein n=1 Tax=Streptomyces TaxID=1883 RepID=UPI001436A404|nr:hypothetical protein [Streptomyces sp. S-2]MBV7254408.1 hypothetical protein [Streptomyces sp. S-2]WSD53085.1 hypothetical protein OHA76_10140 [Streptomyces albidoflavus]